MSAADLIEFYVRIGPNMFEGERPLRVGRAVAKRDVALRAQFGPLVAAQA